MDRQLLSVLLIGVGVVALIGVIFVIRSGWFASKTAAREALAQARGWSYSEGEAYELWRLSGEVDGIRWMTDARRPVRTGPREYDVPHRTRFHASVPGGGAMLGPKIPDGPGGAVARQILVSSQVEAVGQLQAAGQPVPLDGPLAEHFEAVATDVDALSRLTTRPDALLALTDMPRAPILTWHEGEVTITVGHDIRDAETIERFIDHSLQITRELTRD